MNPPTDEAVAPGYGITGVANAMKVLPHVLPSILQRTSDDAFAARTQALRAAAAVEQPKAPTSLLTPSEDAILGIGAAAASALGIKSRDINDFVQAFLNARARRQQAIMQNKAQEAQAKKEQFLLEAQIQSEKMDQADKLQRRLDEIRRKQDDDKDKKVAQIFRARMYGNPEEMRNYNEQMKAIDPTEAWDENTLKAMQLGFEKEHANPLTHVNNHNAQIDRLSQDTHWIPDDLFMNRISRIRMSEQEMDRLGIAYVPVDEQAVREAQKSAFWNKNVDPLIKEFNAQAVTTIKWAQTQSRNMDEKSGAAMVSKVYNDLVQAAVKRIQKDPTLRDSGIDPSMLIANVPQIAEYAGPGQAQLMARLRLDESRRLHDAQIAHMGFNEQMAAANFDANQSWRATIQSWKDFEQGSRDVASAKRLLDVATKAQKTQEGKIAGFYKLLTDPNTDDKTKMNARNSLIYLTGSDNPYDKNGVLMRGPGLAALDANAEAARAQYQQALNERQLTVKPFNAPAAPTPRAGGKRGQRPPTPQEAANELARRRAAAGGG